MSKQRKVKRRKRKTGYINLIKPQGFTTYFLSFKDFNYWVNNPDSW